MLVPLTPGTPVINNVLPTFVPPLSTLNGAIVATASFNSSLLTGALGISCTQDQPPRSRTSGPLAGADLAALVENIMDGDIYVNYHTVKYPAGIMRGQLREVPCINRRFADLMSNSV